MCTALEAGKRERPGWSEGRATRTEQLVELGSLQWPFDPGAGSLQVGSLLQVRDSHTCSPAKADSRVLHQSQVTRAMAE